MEGETNKIRKIFRDVLGDYQELKYIFEYGFYWEDRVTKTLYFKTSQKFRELAEMFSEIFDKGSYALWTDNTEKRNYKLSGRRITRNNHYQLRKNQWYQEVYSSYGLFRNIKADEKVKKCQESNLEKPYSSCKTEGGLCYCRTVCRITEEKEIFSKLAQGGKIKRGDGAIEKEIIEHYKDILYTDSDKEYQLKKNTWMMEHMVPSCMETEEEYGLFMEMIRFFAEFAPLSVLGGNFIRRLGEECASTLFLVRNQYFDFGLEQESIYRCLHAILYGYGVKYQDHDYIPLRLLYKDRGMSGMETHLYLEAKEKNGDTAVLLPLSHGQYIKPSKLKKWQEEPAHIASSYTYAEEKTQDFEVEFYYNDAEIYGERTEYLLRRRENGWAEFVMFQERLPKRHVMESPYYPDNNSWSVDRILYRIRKSDIPGFLLFIQTFGDFARCKDVPKMCKTDKAIMHHTKNRMNFRKRSIPEFQSLLNLYNSRELLQAVEKKGEKLPPRKAELEWLLFILEQCPNLCSVFLTHGSIERLKQKIKCDCKELEGWFSQERCDWAFRIRDIGSSNGHKSGVGDEALVKKYGEILKAIHNKEVLCYEFGGNAISIFPYALEYDVQRHVSRKERTPIDIMCYSMVEKRNLLIRYQDINVWEKHIPQEEYEFTYMDKLYHILAYAVRCAFLGKKNIWSKADHLLDDVWKNDSRGENNYNRCIRKKLRRSRQYEREYAAFCELCKKNPSESVEAEKFQKMVFGYWQMTEGKTEYWGDDPERQYQALLLNCFTSACAQLWAPRKGKDIKECLESFTVDEIWELICGNEKDGIANEIVFYNEQLKDVKVSFTLKGIDEELIDLVYSLFGNFLCVGEVKEKGMIRFTVTYEKFAYRKVHMGLAVLGNRIEDLEPSETADVMKRRLLNMEKNCEL